MVCTIDGAIYEYLKHFYILFLPNNICDKFGITISGYGTFVKSFVEKSVDLVH